MDALLRVDAGTAVIARDVGTDGRAQVGFRGRDQEAAGAQHLRDLHHALVHLRQVVAQRLQRRISRAQRAAAGRFGVTLRQQDRGLDQLQIAEQLAELLLHVQEPVTLHRSGQRDGDAGHELALGEAADRRLVPGVIAYTCLRKERVAYLHVAVEKDALPWDEHVVEHAHRVGLLEAGAERMIPLRLGAVVEGLTADEPQPARSRRNAEGKHVALLALADAGLRIDQELVRGRAVGSEHLGAAHDQPLFRLLDHAEMGEGVLVLVRALGAVGLRIDDGVGEKQVAVAAIGVVVAHIPREPLAALAEEIGALGPGHQHGVEIIGRATDHAEGGVSPDLHRFTALHQVGGCARNQERRAGGSVLSRVGHDVAVRGRDLQVVEVGDRLYRTAEHRVGGDVVDAPARDPDLARLRPQPLDEFLSTTRRHRHFSVPRLPSDCPDASPRRRPAEQQRSICFMAERRHLCNARRQDNNGAGRNAS